ncbi:MAG: hypothetical protein U1D55_17695 [Phycisphaerae bacterium]
MSGREKSLAYGVGGVVAAFLVWQVLQVTVITPFQTLRDGIRTAQTRRVDLQDLIAANKAYKERWQSRTAMTMAREPEETQLRFLGDVASLLDQHHLVEQRSISPRSARTDRKTGLIEVPLQVRVYGNLAGVVGFLKDFYQRPYMVRLESLSIRAEDQGNRGGRGGARGANSDRLDLSFVATTLCLPALSSAPHRSPDPDQPTRTPPVIREAPAYEPIVAINMFKKYVPPTPPPVVVKTPETRPTTEAPRPPPAVDPRAGADKMMLVGTTSMQGELIAFVQDMAHREQPLQSFRPNDPIDDGALVLVHPRGIVVRVEAAAAVTSNESGDATPPPSSVSEYFYALGTNFKERQPISEVEDSEVLSELRWARGGAVGGADQ